MTANNFNTGRINLLKAMDLVCGLCRDGDITRTTQGPGAEQVVNNELERSGHGPVADIFLDEMKQTTQNKYKKQTPWF